MATVLNSLGHYVPQSSQNPMLAASSGYAPQITSQTLVSRIPNLSETGYGSAPTYPQTALYPLQGPKETLKAPPPLGQHYYVDHMMNPHPYSSLYHGIDINAIRRKNATRETTGPLKAWLKAHKKNPYPTKGEKVMLAIATRMTLTQVSTWFANARRRMKKDKVEDEDEDDQDSLPDINNVDKRERSGSISSSISHYSMSDGDTSKDLSDISDIDVDDTTMKKHRPVKKCVQRLFSPDPRSDNMMDPSSSPDSIMSERLTADMPGESRLPAVSDVLPNYISNSKHEILINSCANSQKPKIWSISEIIGSASSTLNTDSTSANPLNYTVPYSDYFSGYPTYSYSTMDHTTVMSGYNQSQQHFDTFSNSQNSLYYL